MQLEGVRRNTRKALLLALVAHVFEGREERAEVERIVEEQAATAVGAKKGTSLLLKDCSCISAGRMASFVPIRAGACVPQHRSAASTRERTGSTLYI